MDENMTTTNPVEVEEHRNLYEVFYDFLMEFFDFIKYIFYGIYLGE